MQEIFYSLDTANSGTVSLDELNALQMSAAETRSPDPRSGGAPPKAMCLSVESDMTISSPPSVPKSAWKHQKRTCLFHKTP